MARATRRLPIRHREDDLLDHALLSSLRDIVSVRDADGILTYCSPSVFGALGWNPGELRGTRERDLIHPGDVDARDDLVASVPPGAPALPPLEVRMRSRDGEWRWFETIEINRLDDPDVHGIISNARDVTARRAEKSELLERALRDPLTGIANRLALMDRLDIALSRAARSHDVVAVLFCDLDDFKLVNDGYGHEFADAVLVEVARRLQDLQRKSDTVARIGGDEFVIVCDGLHDAEEAIAIASRIGAAIEVPITIAGRECVVTSSIGIATYNGATPAPIDPATILRNADAAMYQAKGQDHGRWHHYDDALVEEAAYRFEVEGELAPALAHGEFVLHYEPVYELTSHAVVGVEAFLRWEHPTRGFLRADEFLEVAEQTGVIVPIGAWALRAACGQARRWRDAGWPGWLSLHISPRELSEPGFAATVARTLAETGIDPDRLWIEMHEGALLRAGTAMTNELTSLRDVGVHVGVDHFGTGHTPVPRLQHLPADFLKIDGTLVANLTTDGRMHPAGCAMVAALVQVGTALGMAVIAGGIQSLLERELLVERGCKFGQGDPHVRPDDAAGPDSGTASARSIEAGRP